MSVDILQGKFVLLHVTEGNHFSLYLHVGPYAGIKIFRPIFIYICNWMYREVLTRAYVTNSLKCFIR